MAREGPLGDDSVAQLVGPVAMDGTCELYLIANFTVGCDDLGAPFCRPSAHYFTVGAAIGRTHNGKPSHQFSILHFQFSIWQKENPLESGFSRYLFTYS